jgi:hypothetical protein
MRSESLFYFQINTLLTYSQRLALSVFVIGDVLTLTTSLEEKLELLGDRLKKVETKSKIDTVSIRR